MPESIEDIRNSSKNLMDSFKKDRQKRKDANLLSDKSNPFKDNEQPTPKTGSDASIKKELLKKKLSRARSNAPAEVADGVTPSQVASYPKLAPAASESKAPVVSAPKVGPADLYSSESPDAPEAQGTGYNPTDWAVIGATPLLMGLLMGNMGDAFDVTSKGLLDYEKRKYDEGIADKAAKAKGRTAASTAQAKLDAATLKYKRDWMVAGRKMGHQGTMQEGKFGQQEKMEGIKQGGKSALIDKKHGNKTILQLLGEEYKGERLDKTLKSKESMASGKRQHDFNILGEKQAFTTQRDATKFENQQTRDNAKYRQQFNLLDEKSKNALKVAEVKNKGTGKERFVKVSLANGEIGTWSNLHGLVDNNTKQPIDSSGKKLYQPSDPNQFKDKLVVKRESDALQGKQNQIKEHEGRLVLVDKRDGSMTKLTDLKGYSNKEKAGAVTSVDKFKSSLKKLIEQQETSLSFSNAIETNNPVSDAASIIRLAKGTQGGGVLTDRDVDRLAEAGSIKSKLRQYIKNKKDGKLTDENRRWIKELDSALKIGIKKAFKDRASAEISSMQGLSTISDADYAKAINSYVSPFVGGIQQAQDKYNGVNPELDAEEEAIYKQYPHLRTK